MHSIPRIVVVFALAWAAGAACRPSTPSGSTPVPATLPGSGTASAGSQTSTAAALAPENLVPEADAPLASVLLATAGAPPTIDAAQCALAAAALRDAVPAEGSADALAAVRGASEFGAQRRNDGSLMAGIGAGSNAAVPGLLQLAVDVDPSLRQRAMGALRRIDPGAAVQIAETSLNAPGADALVRSVAANSLARGGSAGLERLVAHAQNGLPEVVPFAVEAWPAAVAYPVAAEALFAPDGVCADVATESCRELFRVLAHARPQWASRLAQAQPVADLILAETRYLLDPAAAEAWSVRVADPATPLDLVAESVLELRQQGLIGELAPAWRRLLSEPSLMGPRTAGALLGAVGALADSGDAMLACAQQADTAEVVALCTAAWVALRGQAIDAGLAARIEAIVNTPGPSQRSTGRVAALVLARTGYLTPESEWAGQFDIHTLNLLRTMGSDDSAAVVRVLNAPELDARTALRAAALWAGGRPAELAAAIVALGDAGPDGRWLELAPVLGDALAPAAPALARTLDDAAAEPSAAAVAWLAAHGQTDPVVRWVDRALAGGSPASRHVAVLTALRLRLSAAPAPLLDLLVVNDATARVETNAWRLDVARLVMASGGWTLQDVLLRRAAQGEGAAGFNELGLVAASALDRCDDAR